MCLGKAIGVIRTLRAFYGYIFVCSGKWLLPTLHYRIAITINSSYRVLTKDSHMVFVRTFIKTG